MTREISDQTTEFKCTKCEEYQAYWGSATIDGKQSERTSQDRAKCECNHCRCDDSLIVVTTYLSKSINQDMEEGDSFNHHRTVTTGEDASTKRKHKLRDDTRHEEHGYTKRAEIDKDWGSREEDHAVTDTI